MKREPTAAEIAAKRPSFDEACRKFVHRYTMEHIPDWARQPVGGKYYAPQFRSDREWYDATVFWPHPLATKRHCHTTGQTWPLGQWLDQPRHYGERYAGDMMGAD